MARSGVRIAKESETRRTHGPALDALRAGAMVEDVLGRDAGFQTSEQ